VEKLCYHIRARDMNIFKPEGKVITFWLYAENEDKLHELLKQKGIKDIEWIIQEDFKP
jgi:tRNA A58 N-methylase Trm61